MTRKINQKYGSLATDYIEEFHADVVHGVSSSDEHGSPPHGYALVSHIN